MTGVQTCALPISAPASICQGSTAPFALTFTGGTVTSYKYFIDLNSNGILDGSEVEVSQVPATGTSDNLSVVINATGTVPVVISWVTGTVGAVSVTSAQTAVSQSVTVDKKPVIQLIY